jgi:polysaccharide biosynthesis/export protein
MAGDLTRGANRENVKLVRQTATGSDIVIVDLKDPNLVQSKYYYIQPNDVLYVEPTKALNQARQPDKPECGHSGLGLISTAVVILNYFN